MILAFRPACTAPFAASQNSNPTARAGITQQALSVSPGLAFPNRRKKRPSHFVFAISHLGEATAF
jgi:hypothetical protein